MPFPLHRKDTEASASGSPPFAIISSCRHFVIIGKSGAHSGGETPVPIPNTEVKPASADGSGLEMDRESRSVPGLLFLFYVRMGIESNYQHISW